MSYFRPMYIIYMPIIGYISLKNYGLWDAGDAWGLVWSNHHKLDIL